MTKDETIHLKKILEPFSTDSTVIEKLSNYIDMIDVYKNRIRLTGCTTIISIIDNLILPSIKSSFFVDKKCLMDIGSGSGVLGITLKLYIKDVQLIIIERNMKKIAFINDVIDKLNIKNVQIILDSLENLESNCLQSVEQLLIRGIKLVDIHKALLDKFPRGTSIIHFASEADIQKVPVQIVGQIPIPGTESHRKALYIYSLKL